MRVSEKGFSQHDSDHSGYVLSKEYSFLDSGLIAEGKFEERDKEKIVKRIEIFDNASFYNIK